MGHNGVAGLAGLFMVCPNQILPSKQAGTNPSFDFDEFPPGL